MLPIENDFLLRLRRQLTETYSDLPCGKTSAFIDARILFEFYDDCTYKI